MSARAGIPLRRWKGKGREVLLESRSASTTEGNGGNDGVVMPMQMTGDGTYNVEYTVPITVGNGQTLSVQVDTGSSDLWLASTSCSSSACSSTNGRLYNPGQALPTGQTFNINYLIGNVSGPIVWDEVQLGGYSITNQALAAASKVDGEPLSQNFDGVLGLALPGNSIIQAAIMPTLGDSPDGAAFSSNLFGITPVSQAPPVRFLSLSLERPGSDRTPSLLGIGRHPSQVAPDPSKIAYSTLLASSSAGVRFWETSIRAITVYVDGGAKAVSLGHSHTGAVYPIAVVDSGVPYIITTSAIANGIYGAIGINPAANGQYYVPCSTPLNMTISLDGQPELPLHPLDLTAVPLQDASSPNCIGLIQAADGALANIPGDMILGVPFLRNVYTVLAYDVPGSNGAFPQVSASTTANSINPRLGLLSLTNATTALDEFHTVRVLNQPLSKTPKTSDTNGVAGKKGLSVGLDVLIGLLSFFGLCAVLFGLRWVLAKRQWRRSHPRGEEGQLDAKDSGYALAALHPNGDGPSEETLRTLRYEAYKRNKRMHSEYSTDSALTKVDVDEREDSGYLPDHELGFRPSFYDKGRHDPHASIATDWRDTLVGEADSAGTPRAKDESPSPEMHRRHLSDPEVPVTAPLLAHARTHSQTSQGSDVGQAGDRVSMAGIGSASRGSRHLEHGLRDSVGSFGSFHDVDGSGNRVYAPSPLRPHPTHAPDRPRSPLEDRGGARPEYEP